MILHVVHVISTSRFEHKPSDCGYLQHKVSIIDFTYQFGRAHFLQPHFECRYIIHCLLASRCIVFLSVHHSIYVVKMRVQYLGLRNMYSAYRRQTIDYSGVMTDEFDYKNELCY